MLLVSGASATVSAIEHLQLGRLYVPRAGNRVEGDLPFAIDNGAFSGFDAELFLSLLDRARDHRDACLWVAAPDVVADAAATGVLFAEWAPRIRSEGYPVALVLQDGITTVPWADIDAVFVGGSTSFKLSSEAAQIVQEARRRGLLAHMGRVNTIRRLKYAYSIGCTSVDGTAFSMFPDTKIGWALDFLSRPPQLSLEAL